MAGHPNHMKADQIPWEKSEHGERFGSQRKRIGPVAGGKNLGCSLYKVPPGRTAFPAHVHHGIEEAIYILAGSGTMRLDDAEIPVGKGDYVAFPVGGPAHQLLNTSQQDLEYLCLSTIVSPEVVEYPDSGKVGVLVMSTGKDGAPVRMAKFFKQDAGVGYYDGE